MKDKIGIFTSVLCLIHCIAFPLLFSLLPFLEIFDWKFELLMIVTAFIVGGWSMFDNLLKHKYFKSIIMFVLGFVILGVGILSHIEWLHWVGMVSLIVAHYLNWNFIKKVDGCHPHKCKH